MFQAFDVLCLAEQAAAPRDLILRSMGPESILPGALRGTPARSPPQNKVRTSLPHFVTGSQAQVRSAINPAQASGTITKSAEEETEQRAPQKVRINEVQRTDTDA